LLGLDLDELLIKNFSENTFFLVIFVIISALRLKEIEMIENTPDGKDKREKQKVGLESSPVGFTVCIRVRP
jgi:hypothetical protein